MHAFRLFLSFILTQAVQSSADLDTNELATFLPEDTDDGLGLSSNDDIANIALDEPVSSLDDSLFLSDTDPPTTIADSDPGSPLEFNDDPPDERPTCPYPKHVRCCPIDIFTKCIHYSQYHPLCTDTRTVYCCQNVSVKNDEGDDLGWEYVCDQDGVKHPATIDDFLDFLRTDVRDWIPPIPFVDGDYQFGGP